MTGTRSQRSFPTSRAPSALASSASSPMPGTRATTHRPTSASKSTWRVRGEDSPPPSNARSAGARPWSPRSATSKTSTGWGATDEGDLLRPSAGGEPVVESPEARAAPDGGQRCHVQHVAHRGSASGDGPAATHQAGVTIDRGDANEGSQLVATDVAQLGQLSKEGACGHVADAGNRLQERLGLAPDRRGLDGLANVAINLGEFFLHEDDMAVEPPGEVLVGRLTATVGLHADHLDDLAPPAY